MAKNDKKIADLLKQIEAKKTEIGTKPKASWKSNGIFKFDNGDHVNINTINSTERCIDVVAALLQKRAFRADAAKLLNLPVEQDSQVEDFLHDFKLRASIVQWDREQAKLNTMQGKLKDLRSEDAKTADALDEIMNGLR